MSYLEERRKHIEAGRPIPDKKTYKLNKVSPKRQKKLDEQAAERGDGDSELQKWYKARMKLLTGRCNECGQHTETKVYKYAIASICHLLAKRPTVCPSVKIHPMNWIELCPYHHDQLDKSNWEEIEKWGCWETIRDRLVHVYQDLDKSEIRHFPQSVIDYMEKNKPF